MNARENAPVISPEGKRLAAWKSSLYEEPLWKSVAWLLGPVLCAAIGIYFAVS
jgi:hypothetical protein